MPRGSFCVFGKNVLYLLYLKFRIMFKLTRVYRLAKQRSQLVIKFWYLPILLSSISSSLIAQPRIPFLGKNGLYGLVDTCGTIVEEPYLNEFPKSALGDPFLPPKAKQNAPTVEWKLVDGQWKHKYMHVRSLAWQGSGAKEVLALVDAEGQVLKEFEWASRSNEILRFQAGYSVLQNHNREYCLIDSFGHFIIPFTKDLLAIHEDEQLLIRRKYVDRSAHPFMPFQNTILRLDGTLIMDSIQNIRRHHVLQNGWVAIELERSRRGCQKLTEQPISVTQELLVLDENKNIKYLLNPFRLQEIHHLDSKRFLFIGNSEYSIKGQHLYVVDAISGKEYREE